MKLLDAGHGHMIGFQRRKSELWLWQNWTRWMPGGGRRFYLVRFRWRSRVAPYTWEDPPLDMQVMPTFHDDQTVVYAQLDPLGKYIAYRVGGGGYDRFELRTLGDVERGIDRVLDRAGPFPTTKDTAQAAGWADRYTVQGFATVGGRLWRYTGDGTGTNRSRSGSAHRVRLEQRWRGGPAQRTEGHWIPRARHTVGARGLDHRADRARSDQGAVGGGAGADRAIASS
jgi:hypothetical protein